MKEVLGEILSEFHQAQFPNIMKRNVVLPKIPKTVRKALVFIGMRRVGKTFLMYQHMQQAVAAGVAKEKLLHINFEDDRLSNFSQQDFQTILDVYFERYPAFSRADDLIFYFDEIQQIDGWEKFIRRLLDKERMSILITGSSAKLLSKEIATALRGRCLVREVFPLSFCEYLNYQGVHRLEHLSSKDKARIRHHAQTYLKRGGFPETLTLTASLHHSIIQSYVDAAVFRDVIERYQLKNAPMVKMFLVHCLQNIAAPLSVTKIYNTLKSRGETVGRASLYEYLTYFADAYLIYLVPIFDLSTRKRQVNPSKIYCVDAAVIYAYSMKPQTESAASLENVVYIQLRKLQFENIYYYKTRTGKEVDFLAQQPNGQISLFQVCMNLDNEKTKQRELAALAEAAKELSIDEAWIITFDSNDAVVSDGINIRVLPYWQWVIGDWPRRLG